MAGSWSGKGTVKVRTNSPTINVTCQFTSDTTPQSLSLDGKCTSLAIFSRAISADLKATGSQYAGSYVVLAPVRRGLADSVPATRSTSASPGRRRSMVTDARR